LNSTYFWASATWVDRIVFFRLGQLSYDLKSPDDYRELYYRFSEGLYGDVLKRAERVYWSHVADILSRNSFRSFTPEPAPPGRPGWVMVSSGLVEDIFRDRVNELDSEWCWDNLVKREGEELNPLRVGPKGSFVKGSVLGDMVECRIRNDQEQDRIASRLHCGLGRWRKSASQRVEEMLFGYDKDGNRVTPSRSWYLQRIRPVVFEALVAWKEPERTPRGDTLVPRELLNEFSVGIGTDGCLDDPFDAFCVKRARLGDRFVEQSNEGVLGDENPVVEGYW